MNSGIVHEFSAAISGPPNQVDLFGAAMSIARIGRPEGTAQNVDAHAVARELDLIAEAVREQAGETPDQGALAHAVDHQLFTVLGYHGATDDYNNPANSYLDEVVARRTGIPITLSLVYMEVSQRVGLQCEGIGYPGHFIVRCGRPANPIYVDPYHQGARLDREELLAGLRSMHLGGARPETFLSAVTPRQLLQRMLNNLHIIFREQRDIPRWHLAVELLLALEPWSATLTGERGMLHYRLGEPRKALADLERYVAASNALQPGGAPTPATPGVPIVSAGALRLLDELRLHFGGAGDTQ